MSVLITGMEMPESCGDCPCLSETYCCCVDGVYPYECNILIQETEEGAEFIGRLSNCPLVEAPKWIPVTERLPERNYNCLVADDGTIVYGYMNFIGEWMDCIGDKLKYVSHWMPLPEPPESGGE